MRILQISSAKAYGGGERLFVDLCRELRARGHEVFVALRPSNEWQERLSFLPPDSIFHVSIRNSFGVLSAKRIAGFVRDKNIQLIHAHVARDYIPASIACALTKNTKFVITRHLLFPLKPFNKFALKNLSMAIAVSAGAGRALEKVFPREKIAVIPNGVAVEMVEDEDRQPRGRAFRVLHGISADAPLIGIVGELIVLKGQRDFIIAANEIAKKFPSATFAIVGRDNTADKKFRRELQRLTNVFRLDDRFIWLDWVNDTGPMFAALDILVSTSHTESFGMAILEAMASGTPVIATATEGAKEIMPDSEMLVPVHDPIALAGKLCELVGDPLRRVRLAEEGRARAIEYFSLSGMIDSTEKIYATLLETS